MPHCDIFDDICHSADGSAQHVSFADLDSAMYKRRRCAQPSLPTSPTSADAVMRSNRYAKLEDVDFYDADNGSALVVTSMQQLHILESATEVYFDAAFKVVQSRYI